MTTGADISLQWKNQLLEENQAMSLRNVRILAVVAMILVPLCSVLDWFAYPQLWSKFLTVRILAASCEILFLLLTFTAVGRKHFHALMLLVPMMPVVTISWMIHRSGEAASPYYVGLILCLVGYGLLFQWGYLQSLLAVGITFACYLMATVPLLLTQAQAPGVFGQFINNGVFLLANSAVIVIGNMVHERIRHNEVLSRYGLADSRRELEQKNLQLVEMDRMKTDFFSNITHELRTPLTLMIAPLQRLQRLCAESGAAISAGNVDLMAELGGIYQNALRLLKLINDLLDLASADAGRLRMVKQRFSLKLFTGRLLQSVFTMAQQCGVQAKEDQQVRTELMEADQEKLEKILLNLLFNAVKFTPAGGTVTLRTIEQDGALVFEVQDTGIGIAQKNLPFIFDRFWQADSSVTRQHPGTGLGLALVKELAEKMQGRVEAESTQGMGTTFRVWLPFTRSGDLLVLHDGPEVAEPTSLQVAGASPLEVRKDVSEAEPAPLAKSSSAEWIHSIYREAERVQSTSEVQVQSRNGNHLAEKPVTSEKDRHHLPAVVLVDDEPGMLQFMRLELEPYYRVYEASDGLAALQAVEAHAPDLVIADYMMPNLDGLGLCRRVRANAESRLLPIMLVTARSDEEVRLTALRNGANDVLVKPFSLTEFHTRAQNLVQSARLQKDLEASNQELTRTLKELRATEEDLIRSEKMASLGILTGGILHEINNPLNFARSALYVLDRRAGSLPQTVSGEIQEVVADIGEGINRITSIVSDLRLFCHPGVEMSASCALVEPLQSALRILTGPLLELDVKFHQHVPANLRVSGDKNQLTMVFMNLIKNSVDALATEPPDTNPTIWVEAQEEGSELELRIRDNGPGIPAEHLAKIFDPFFTTKPAGEGTGLGLSICYRIVTAHGGSIRVINQKGRGLEFILRLRRDVTPTPLAEAAELLPALTA